MKSMKIIGLSLILSLFGSINSFANTIQNSVSDKLSTSQWHSIKKQIDAENYRPKRASTSGFLAENISHEWQINYQENGQTVLKPLMQTQNIYHIGLKLQTLGGQSSFTHTKPLLSVQGSKFVYHWNENIKEIWTNTPQSLEQWFEIKQRPKSLESYDKLILQLAIDTNLKITQKNNALNFEDKITYDKLKVWDVQGTEITAKMELKGTIVSLIIDDEKAVYPLTIDPTFAQRNYLKATVNDVNDRFGDSIAVSGSTLVVGAPYEDSANTVNDNSLGNSGAVYLFEKNASGNWIQDFYLKPNTIIDGDEFGTSVAVDGDTLVIASLSNVYVFERNGTGLWIQDSTLTSSNFETDDQFGYAIDIDNNFIIVGAIGEDGDGIIQTNNSKSNAGAAYIFEKVSGNWVQKAYLKASNVDAGDEFGYKVQVDGYYAIISAIHEEGTGIGVNPSANNNSVNSGAVYSFKYNTNTQIWSQDAYIKPQTSNSANIFFGSSMSLKGERLVVTDHKAFTVFDKSNGTWAQQYTEDVYYFLPSVAIEGDTLIIGDRGNNSQFKGVADGNDPVGGYLSSSGAVHVYKKSGNSWDRSHFIKASNANENDNFGQIIAYSNATIFVGTPFEDSDGSSLLDNSASDTGAVYVYSTASRLSGTISGLYSGNQVVVQNNSTNDFVIDKNGNFNVPTGAVSGESYSLSVLTQPTTPAQTCSITSGASGTASGVDINNIVINCVSDFPAIYDVNVTVSGLAPGNTVIIQNNGGNDLTFNANTTATFSQKLSTAAGYDIKLKAEPSFPNQYCNISNGNGTVTSSNINVQVVCQTKQYFLDIDVAGLTVSESVIISVNSNQSTLTGSGIFRNYLFDDGTIINASIQQQPSTPNKICTLDTSPFAIPGNDIRILVKCFSEYSVGGKISGLANNAQITLKLGNETKIFTQNGGYAFNTSYLSGTNLVAVVDTQPNDPNQYCILSSSSVSITNTSISNLDISCETQTYAIGVSVNGLGVDRKLVLGMTGSSFPADELTVYSSANVIMNQVVADHKDYKVFIKRQPFNQSCVLHNGEGNVNGVFVNDISIICTVNSGTTYTIGGSVSGLVGGESFIIQVNGGDDETISSNGSYTFNNALNDLDSYYVTTKSHPAGKTCSIKNEYGHINGRNITNVSITCTAPPVNTYSLNGEVFGLGTGSNSGTLKLKNGSEIIDIHSNGTYSFPTRLTNGTSYSITVEEAPSAPNRTCIVSPTGIGTINNADVNNIYVTCVTTQYRINASLSGLGSGKTIVLQNNQSDDLNFNSNTAQMFATSLTDASAYHVTVKTQPTGQNCVASSSSGTLQGADVTINLTCTNDALPKYTIGGDVSGLASGASVGLSNGSDTITVSANIGFTFPTAINQNSTYAVTVTTQPANHTCQINSGSGSVTGANITDVKVICSSTQPTTYTVGGNVIGLGVGKTLVLQNNSADNETITTTGVYTFDTAVLNGTDYAVTVLTQPSGQTCIISNATGSSSSNVSNVDVSCSDNSGMTYTLGGDVFGLNTGQQLVLQNNNADDKTINSSGSFTFATALNDNSNYTVTIKTQPSTQTCQVFGGNNGNDDGTGTISSQNDNSLFITCDTAPTVVNDSYTIDENAFLDANDFDGSVGGVEDDGVLVNDSDLESDQLNIDIPGSYTADGIGGDLTIYFDGTFTYNPPFNTSGVATFNYDVTDGILTTAATLTIIVGTSNDLIFKNGFEVVTTQKQGEISYLSTNDAYYDIYENKIVLQNHIYQLSDDKQETELIKYWLNRIMNLER